MVSISHPLTFASINPFRLTLEIFGIQLIFNCCFLGKHGSLAHAVKVRKQTHKVEKQDKPKKPTGRAKKRMLYKRRLPILEGSAKRDEPTKSLISNKEAIYL